MNARHRPGWRWLVLLAGLPLLLPLRAAEAPPPAPPQEPAGAEQPEPGDAQAGKPAAAERQAPPPKAADAADEEQVSLDNNLSFPVDI